MKYTDKMDYIYGDDNERILIEPIQQKTRNHIIEQFIKLRKAKKMTQDDVARKAGMARTNITRFESGNYNPSLEMMVRIAAAMDMELEMKLVEK